MLPSASLHLDFESFIYEVSHGMPIDSNNFINNFRLQVLGHVVVTLE